jgi:WhiB family redox-sensing transcriptional regulator
MFTNTIGGLAPVGLGNSMDEHIWRDQAACKGMEAEEFFPARGTYSTQTLAMRACASCEVKEPCLEFALKFNEPGVWGGTSSRQRRQIRKERRAERIENGKNKRLIELK